MRQVIALFFVIAVPSLVALRVCWAADHCATKAVAARGECTDRCTMCPRHKCCTNKCGCDNGNGPPCDHVCKPPCKQPPPSVPREGFPEEEIPGVPREGFVTPPATGVIEGPSRGVEWGGIGITLPEVRLSTPKLRFSGLTRLHQKARMRTDEAIAPLMQNPQYAHALAMREAYASQARGAERDDERGAERDEGQDRDAKKDDESTNRGADERCSNNRSAKRESTADVERKLKELESCVRQQVEDLNNCLKAMQNLQQQQQNAPTKGSPQQAPTSPTSVDLQPIPEPRFDDHNARQGIRPLPPVENHIEGGELRQTSYVFSTPVPPPASRRPDIQRLPPIDR